MGSLGTSGGVQTTCGDGATAGKITSAVGIGPDGTIAAAGGVDLGPTGDVGPTGPNGLALARYGASDRLDRLVQVPHRGTDAMAIQPDGKIVVAFEPDGGPGVELARYTTSGKLDTSFGTGGEVQTDSGPSSRGFATAIEPDGKIVVAVDVHVTSRAELLLARYTTSGKPDTSFGTGGTLQADVEGSALGESAVAIEPDGKVVLAGLPRVGDHQAFALARYTTSGKLDTSFGTDGTVPTDFGGLIGANAVATEPDGKIVVIGYSRGNKGSRVSLTLARYTASGALDASFGTGGETVTHSDWIGCAAAIEPDGKILVLAHHDRYRAAAIALIRYTTRGVLDRSFATNGTVVTHLKREVGSWAAAIQPDGKIVVVGYTGAGFALVRYLR